MHAGLDLVEWQDGNVGLSAFGRNRVLGEEAGSSGQQECSDEAAYDMFHSTTWTAKNREPRRRANNVVASQRTTAHDDSEQLSKDTGIACMPHEPKKSGKECVYTSKEAGVSYP